MSEFLNELPNFRYGRNLGIHLQSNILRLVEDRRGTQRGLAGPHFLRPGLRAQSESPRASCLHLQRTTKFISKG